MISFKFSVLLWDLGARTESRVRALSETKKKLRATLRGKSVRIVRLLNRSSDKKKL